MSFVVEERHELILGEGVRGRGSQGGGGGGRIDMSTMQKRGSDPAVLLTLIVYRL